MAEASQIFDFVDSTIRTGIEMGIGQLRAEDPQLDGRSVTIKGVPCLNFASCSYLGLELDERLREGAIRAVERYGTQFSSSRAYVSAPQYEELEALLGEITGGRALVTPNTTLGSFAALPVLISDADAVILDHHVHHTVQMMIPMLRAQGTAVEFVRHGRLNSLEERIRELARTHRRVWYLADGVYSMYGTLAPFEALRWLLSQHEQLHLYIDDAHGMSWWGKHGRGCALEGLPERSRVVVAVSLNKSFGAGGGAVIFPDEAMCSRVRNCGPPMIFTGPLQPPMLGAAVASARIHLTEEIERLQAELLERIRFANRRAVELDLPLVSRSEVPIRFVGLGPRYVAGELTRRLIRAGFLANCAAFPAVPAKRSGLRFTITRHLSLDDIDRLLTAVARELPDVLVQEGATREEIDRAFGLRSPGRRAARLVPMLGAETMSSGARLACEHQTRIEAVDQAEWDRCLADRGSYSWEGLRMLERAFGEHQKPENRWRFHYYAVRDQDGSPVLVTFFTEALWKDDALAPASVSRAVEARRGEEPHYLTSTVFAMGSLFTEGNHLYLDRRADWRGALHLLLSHVAETADAAEAQTVALRDLPAEDQELDAFLRRAGFAAIPLPDSMLLELNWSSREEFLSRLSYRSRRFQRRVVIPLAEAFEVEVLRAGGRVPSDAEWAHLYGLYRNVQSRSFEISTFPLPEDLLPTMLEHPGWEIATLTLRPEFGGEPSAPPQAFVACYQGPEQYVPILVGLDYRFVHSHEAYRQCIHHVVGRARHHGCRRVHFGVGAELEKRRFGAVPLKRILYVQSQDHYQHDVLALLSSDPTAE